MGERQYEMQRGNFFEAANSLRDHLQSHIITGGVIAELSAAEGFNSDFTQAETPRHVLAAISRFGSIDHRTKIASIVDGWVNNGKVRNTTAVSQIIRKEYQHWVRTF